MVDREQLADFLKTRREALQPEDVGLPRGIRRGGMVCGVKRLRHWPACRPTITAAWNSSAASRPT